MIWPYRGIFHLNSMFSLRQHAVQTMSTKHRAAFLLILTLGVFSGAPVSVCGSPPTACSCLTPDPYCTLGSGQSSPGSALEGLEQAGDPQNPSSPTERRERRVEKGEEIKGNERTRSNKPKHCNLHEHRVIFKANNIYFAGWLASLFIKSWRAQQCGKTSAVNCSSSTLTGDI